MQEVEKNGNAYAAGLRPGARLVEACNIAVATLTYDQLVDVLKTSTVVTVTIVLPYTQRDGKLDWRICVFDEYTAEGIFNNFPISNDQVTSTTLRGEVVANTIVAISSKLLASTKVEWRFSNEACLRMRFPP